VIRPAAGRPARGRLGAVQELRGCNALVTGAGGGLGGYIARALAVEGANLALTDLPQVSLDGLAAELRGRGIRVEQAAADLADREERRRLAAWGEETLGPLDVLVNNAGLEFGGSFLRSTEDELEAIVAVNLLAVMDLTRLVLGGMLERGRGHVVNIASMAGKAPAPYLATYAATKHGAVGLTHSLRAEYGAEPVGFSAICPAFVSGAGMYARLERELASAPNPVGTVPPERVGRAVVRAIRDNPAEIVLGPRILRPMIPLYALSPRIAARVARNRRAVEFAQHFARARGRL
jgi:short-subunit dehydrogenase